MESNLSRTITSILRYPGRIRSPDLRACAPRVFIPCPAHHGRAGLTCQAGQYPDRWGSMGTLSLTYILKKNTNTTYHRT